MILCIDSGNTRIKWGLRADEGWLATGAVPHAEAGRLADLLPTSPPPARIMVANVAGPEAAAAIGEALAPWTERLVFVRAEAARAGVGNGYAEPESLGVDRWCALVGARQAASGACLVVGAGTATTIDTLDAEGHFLGGMILPGFELMRASLARNTANLTLAAGEYEAYPRRTGDAIYSGCLEAQLGAIERAFARIATAPDACCLLFGGAAPLLDGHLAIPRRRVDTLVLDGLFQLAHEPSLLPGVKTA